MGRMKKAAQHQMYREDVGAALESLAVGGSGIEELIGTAMYSGIAVDIFLCTGEFAMKSMNPPVAADPNWQWAVDHRFILAKMIRSVERLVGFDVAGFKPFQWLQIVVEFPGRWRVLMETATFARPNVLPALPMADRLLFASFFPSLMYTMVKVIANVPRLVGDLLPG